jgi:hypothetical protein
MSSPATGCSISPAPAHRRAGQRCRVAVPAFPGRRRRPHCFWLQASR